MEGNLAFMNLLNKYWVIFSMNGDWETASTPIDPVPCDLVEPIITKGKGPVRRSLPDAVMRKWEFDPSGSNLISINQNMASVACDNSGIHK